MDNSVVREQIGTGLEVIMEGLPQSVMTPAVQAQAALALVKHGIPAAGSYTAGVIGGIRYATLKVGNEYYKLKYSFIVMRAITALEIFNEATQWIEFQKLKGSVDPKLADLTTKYLYDQLDQEFKKFLNG
ncbi:hypothetical protein [Argonema galeatum]|uniref:hypothetical protein n=1 Tax=Argonema galeatum TaxID=2942762 RepID=UPI0020135B66|nr:hypothetical protein [Argonema galeatum]MCL1468017.1 hypothetical protein [Argonema galeatum A003/A1]